MNFITYIHIALPSNTTLQNIRFSVHFTNTGLSPSMDIYAFQHIFSKILPPRIFHTSQRNLF